MKRIGMVCVIGSWLIWANAMPALASEANEDALVSTTAFGTDLIVESLSVGRHFAKTKSMGASVFERRREDEVEIDEPSGLAWRLGYAFVRPNTPEGTTLSLTSHGVLVGLSLRSSPTFAMSAWVRGETTPDLDYRHGQVGLRADFMIPLASAESAEPAPKAVAKGESSEEESASEYYRKRSRLFNPKKVELERPDYPRLRLGAVLQFEKGLYQGDDGTTGETSISYYGLGPELNLDLNSSLTLGASGLFFVYPDLVQPFLRTMGLTTGREYTVYSPAGLLAAAPQVLVFPSMIFDQHVTYRMTSVVLDLNFNETLYILANQDMTFTVTPTLTFLLSQRWLFSAGVNVGFGGSGTAVQGLVNLMYRL